MFPPQTALTVQQTLLASHSMARGHPVPPKAALLPRSNTLTGMMPGVEGALLLPAFTVGAADAADAEGTSGQQQRQQGAERPGSMKMVLRRMDTSVALQVWYFWFLNLIIIIFYCGLRWGTQTHCVCRVVAK